MDPATMSYAQLLRAYQALQEHVIALEVLRLYNIVRRPGSTRRSTAGTGATVSVPEAYLTGGGRWGSASVRRNWSATPLGPVATWPQSLKSAVSILLPSKAQIILFWGPELIAIYNDAYARCSARASVGPRSARARCWSEVWHVLGPLFEGVIRTGESVLGEGPPLLPLPPGIPRRDVL